MPEKNLKVTIEECLERIASQLPGFKHRPQQKQMINAVMETLSQQPERKEDELGEGAQNGESILVIEGPTGTGKSLAYLLPSVVMAKALGKKLVVSSATVMLQEQLANKDIPFLAKQAGLDISYAIAKGRGRYACTAKLKQQVTGTIAEDQSQVPLNLFNENDLFYELASLLDKNEWSGDRDSLTKNVPDILWSRITNDRHGCVKKLCPYFITCPFYKARQTLEEVDIIIANHDLLLADIAMGGGVILPEPAETFYCLDEAHHLAEKAVKQFAASHSINGTLVWLEKTDITVNKALGLLKYVKPVINVRNLVEAIAEYLQDFSQIITNNFFDNKDSKVFRFKNGIVPEALMPLCENLAKATKSLHNMLCLLQEHLKKAKAEAEGNGVADVFNRSLIDLGFFIGRTENLMAVWTLFSHKRNSDEPPIAKWITAEWTDKNQQEQLDYTMSASPVSAAKLLSHRFWKNVAGAVLTSATLRSLGKFDLLLKETGLSDYPKTSCIALDSPFDFQQQGKIIVPAMRSDPKDPVAHTQEIITLLPRFLPKEGSNGSLVLFASRKQMHDVAKGIPDVFQQQLLIQGEHSKEILLKKHFARVNNNCPSVLFGLASFAEGLDLPGNACNCLIIAKLPFAVPDDPVSETMADWITERGGNPFMEMTLPITSIKLIQAVGRLIRTETDSGTVAILDTRLKTKYYGKLLLKSLPPFREISLRNSYAHDNTRRQIC